MLTFINTSVGCFQSIFVLIIDVPQKKAVMDVGTSVQRLLSSAGLSVPHVIFRSSPLDAEALMFWDVSKPFLALSINASLRTTAFAVVALDKSVC